MPALRITCCGILRRARVILDGGFGGASAGEQRSHTPPCEMHLFVLVALAIVVSASPATSSVIFLDLGLTLRLYSKYPNFIFFKGCITGLFFFFHHASYSDGLWLVSP